MQKGKSGPRLKGALAISLAIHALALAFFSHQKIRLRPREFSRPLEVAYLRSAPLKTEIKIQTPDFQRTIKKSDLPDAAPADKERIWKEAERSRDFARDKIKTSLQQTSETVTEIKIVTLPHIPEEVFKIPEYKSYYQLIREKIRRLAYSLYGRQQEEGEIFLTFVLTATGEIKDVSVNDAKSTPSASLRKIAEKSVRDASPFPPFPVKLRNNNTLSFNIIILFEIK